MECRNGKKKHARGVAVVVSVVSLCLSLLFSVVSLCLSLFLSLLLLGSWIDFFHRWFFVFTDISALYKEKFHVHASEIFQLVFQEENLENDFRLAAERRKKGAITDTDRRRGGSERTGPKSDRPRSPRNGDTRGRGDDRQPGGGGESGTDRPQCRTKSATTQRNQTRGTSSQRKMSSTSARAHARRRQSAGTAEGSHRVYVLHLFTLYIHGAR